MLYLKDNFCKIINIIQLLHGDYLDSDLKVDTASGQTEYEFPLLTNDKQKKSDRVTFYFE